MEQETNLNESPPLIEKSDEEEKKEEVVNEIEARFQEYQENQEKQGSPSDKLSRSKLLYEADPEDLELRQKLLESKIARKKTEEDSKVLLNRLQLLKNEEQKAWKKIEETKRKALEIMKVKQRNAEIIRKKQDVICLTC
jgi:hypothetical protein